MRASILVLLLAACSGPQPQKPVEKPVQPQASASAAPVEVGPTREDRIKHKEKVIALSCLNQVPEEKEFCSCIARELVHNLTLEELESTTPNAARLSTAQAQANDACPASESMVKSNYLNACLADRKEMAPYCDCTWTEFRKTFSAAEMGSNKVVSGEKFAEQRKPIAKACEKQITEKIVQETFMKECAKNPANEKFCTCAWKEARKMGSPAEIDIGVVSINQIGEKAEVACKTLRPKPPAPPPAEAK